MLLWNSGFRHFNSPKADFLSIVCCTAVQFQLICRISIQARQAYSENNARCCQPQTGGEAAVPDTIAVFVVSDDRAADMRKTGANLVRFTRNQQQFKCTRSAVR